MQDDGPSPRPARSERAAWHGRWVIGLGVALIALAALHLAAAGYGTRPRRDFAERRSYDMVKPAVHRALPRSALLGTAGLAFVLAGGRLRRR